MIEERGRKGGKQEEHQRGTRMSAVGKPAGNGNDVFPLCLISENSAREAREKAGGRKIFGEGGDREGSHS